MIAVTIQPRHTGLQQGQDEPARVQKTTQMHTKTQIHTEKKALINLEHDRAEHSSSIKIIQGILKNASCTSSVSLSNLNGTMVAI